MSKTAIILGATGLTGSLLLRKLLKNDRYNKIKLFSRSKTTISNPKIEEYIVDLLRLKNYSKDFIADEIFCCIGTTNTRTPDKKLYHQIDYGIPLSAAQLCKENNISTLIIISALGANANSRIFYNRTKGEMERDVLTLEIPKTHILQPSLIGGYRSEKRAGEFFFKQLMNLMNPLLIGTFKKYRMIHPETIVSAMIWLANNSFNTSKIPSDEIKEIALK